MALNITPPMGHLAANFPGLPQQIGLLGAGDIPTTGLLGPFTPMNLPDYTGDLPTSAFDVTSYVEKYKEDQKKKNGGGDGDGNGNFGAEGGGATGAGLGLTPNEIMYPGYAAAAAAAGVGGLGSLWGQGKVKNEAWRDALRAKMGLKPGEKFFANQAQPGAISYKSLVNQALISAGEKVETTNQSTIAAAVNDFIDYP